MEEEIRTTNSKEILVINTKITQIKTVSKVILTKKIKIHGEVMKGKILIVHTIRIDFKTEDNKTEDLMGNITINKDSLMEIKDNNLLVLNMEINSNLIEEEEEVMASKEGEGVLGNKEVLGIIMRTLLMKMSNKTSLSKTDKETTFRAITLTGKMIKVQGIHVDNNMMVPIINKVTNHIIINKAKDRSIIILLVNLTSKEIRMAIIKGIQIKGQETLAEIITGEGMEAIRISTILGAISQYQRIFLHLNPFQFNPILQSKFHSKINHLLQILKLF